MRSLYLSFSLLLVTFTVAGQQHLQNANWVYAWNNAATFLPDPYNPTPLSGSELPGYEGCASVSNQQGELLFYTNGSTVWNSNHVVMTNGSGLFGGDSNTQLAIIPRPKYPDRYYIITIGGMSGFERGLYYSEVDMSNWPGEVIAKNIVFRDHNGVAINQAYANKSEKVTSTIHSNGVDYWMVTQVNNNIYSYIISDAGPSETPNSTTPSLMDLTVNSKYGQGQMKISPDNHHIGICYSSSSGKVYLGEFDNTSGLVTLDTNPIVIPGSTTYYGLEFSPLSQYLYFTTDYNLHGLNLSNGNIEYTEQISLGITGKGLQLAINGKIYIALSGYWISAINTPDDISNPDVVSGAIQPLQLPETTTGTTMGLPQWVHWHVNQCQPNITLSIPDTNFQPFTYGYLDFIITNDNYMVTQWQNISMIAGDYILLQPNTSIQSGSVFLAQIDDCVGLDQASVQQRSMDTNIFEKEEGTNGFTVYPNPTNGQLTVTFESKVSSFSIIDITGKELMKINNDNPNEITFDISGLASGVYFLSADGMPIQKIIKN